MSLVDVFQIFVLQVFIPAVLGWMFCEVLGPPKTKTKSKQDRSLIDAHDKGPDFGRFYLEARKELDAQDPLWMQIERKPEPEPEPERPEAVTVVNRSPQVRETSAADGGESYIISWPGDGEVKVRSMEEEERARAIDAYHRYRLNRDA